MIFKGMTEKQRLLAELLGLVRDAHEDRRAARLLARNVLVEGCDQHVAVAALLPAAVAHQGLALELRQGLKQLWGAVQVRFEAIHALGPGRAVGELVGVCPLARSQETTRGSHPMFPADVHVVRLQLVALADAHARGQPRSVCTRLLLAPIRLLMPVSTCFTLRTRSPTEEGAHCVGTCWH